MALTRIIEELSGLEPWTMVSDEIVVPGRRPVHRRTFAQANFPFDGITDLGDANVIVPVIEESEGRYGKAVLVAQFRPRDEYLVEFPGGNIKGKESRTGAALRELVEETGIVAKTLVRLGSLVPRDGYLLGATEGYLALGRAAGGERSLDEEEHEQGIRTFSAPIGEVAQLMYGASDAVKSHRFHTSQPSALAFERAMSYLAMHDLLSEDAKNGLYEARAERFATVLDAKSI